MPLVEVTESEFFAAIGPRDIVLSTRRDCTIWETRNRLQVGKSTPGYVGGSAKAYYLDRAAVAATPEVR